MFKYTKTGIRVILDDIKKIGKIFEYGSLIFTSVYYILSIFFGWGNVIVNVILALLFLLSTILKYFSDKKKGKTARRISDRLYNLIRIIVKTITLGASLYGMYLGTVHSSALSIILTVFMIILWIFDVVFEVLGIYITERAELVMTGFNKDMEWSTKIGNWFKSSENKTELIDDNNKYMKILKKQIEKEEKAKEKDKKK